MQIEMQCNITSYLLSSFKNKSQQQKAETINGVNKEKTSYIIKGNLYWKNNVEFLKKT